LSSWPTSWAVDKKTDRTAVLLKEGWLTYQTGRLSLWPWINSVEGGYMHSTKYRDLLALLILLDEVESRAKALAELFPELRTVAEATSNAADLCDLAVTVEDIADDRLFGRRDRSP
jgi:hypothetical protein